MKLTLKLLTVLLWLISLDGQAAKVLNIEHREIPAYVKSLKLLKRGPPDNVLPKERANIRTTIETIEQKLDHFDENETRTWQMRYMANNMYFKAAGPIFIYLGGEWNIGPDLITSGQLVDMARENNGYLYYTEHRYYGQSQPTSSLTVANMKYLHVKQALADLAHFIRTKKQTVPGLENSKVIIAGGSYSASMVVWFKRLYPELIDGGWASSGPLLAKLDFKEYLEVAGLAFLELGGQACYDRIQNGIAELEYMMDNKRDAELKAMFKICDNFNVDNKFDIYTFFGSIINSFSSIAQHQSGNSIPNTCNYLMNFEDDLTAITEHAMKSFDSSSCQDMSFMKVVEYYKDTTYQFDNDRQWLYQTCNEFGWFQTTTSRNQPFGTKCPTLMFTTICRIVFGETFTEEFIEQQIAQTNVDFGGMNPNVENVYMTQGGLDPWIAMGHGELEGATVIPLASHISDTDSISLNDSMEMRASKERLAELVRDWVSDNSTKKYNKK